MSKDESLVRKVKTQETITFWRWFVIGSGGRPGFTKIVNAWLAVHLLIGIILSVYVESPLDKAANSILLPLLGVFVGLSFSWAGTIYPVLQSEKFDSFVKESKGGYVDYLFTFQCAVLVMLTTLVSWGLAGIGVLNDFCVYSYNIYMLFKVLLYTLISVSIRECWHVVLGVQMMIIIQKRLTTK